MLKTLWDLEDFCYAHFSPMARLILKTYNGLEDDMEAANMKIHPEVYLSLVSFLVTLASMVFLIYLSLLFARVIPFTSKFLYLATIFGIIPFVALIIGVLMPKFAASNRISGIKNEIPYASMYLSVMTSGGLSPFASLIRLHRTTLLPQLKKEIGRIQRIAITSKKDEISAMATAARVIGLREFKELLLGYASTTRTGGDVLHYLYIQTESMFRGLAMRTRSMGESMGILLESYTIVSILGGLGLYMVFIVSLSFPAFQAFPPDMFLLFAFIVLPSVSLVFIYLGDSLQLTYPISQWKPYYGLFASVPFSIFLLTQLVLPFYDVKLFAIPILAEIPIRIRELLGLNLGSEPALGLTISLIALAFPVYALDDYYSRREKGILQGVTVFIRDLVENRKTGLGPEKSIQTLSDRDYGNFSKHLKTMSAKISWGIPLRKIFEDLLTEIKDWPSLMNLYILIDAIEVGGGTEESLETLAEFAESSRELEAEKWSLLKPMLLVPYMGAALLTITTVMLLQVFVNMSSIGSTMISVNSLTKTLVTPLILNALTIGLVAGKITSGRTSSGFKHGIALMLISIIGVWLAGKVF